MRSEIGAALIVLGIFLFALLIIVAAVALPIWQYWGTEHDVNVTVKEKWVKYQGGDAKYLVSDTNGNIYEITDSLWKWKWNSSDQYAEMQTGQNYTIGLFGKRVPFFSAYPDVITVKPV